MKNRNIVITFLVSSLLFVVYFFGTLFVYDLLKLFHKPWKYKEYLQRDMRRQAAGIIRHWDLDSIILDTSILERTSAKESSRELGGEICKHLTIGKLFL